MSEAASQSPRQTPTHTPTSSLSMANPAPPPETSPPRISPSRRAAARASPVRSSVGCTLVVASPLPRCAVCNAPNANICAMCSSIAYCSDTCHAQDHRFHALLCASLAEFTAQPRPCPGATLAIYFSEAPNKPELIWVEDVVTGSGLPVLMKVEKGGSEEEPKYSELLGEQEISHERAYITYNWERGEENFPLDHTIVVHHRDNSHWDGKSRTNLAIMSLTQGLHLHDWRGPVVMFAEWGIYGDGDRQDVTLADLRVFRDFLKNCGDGLEDSLKAGDMKDLEEWNPSLWKKMLDAASSNPETIKAVKISCKVEEFQGHSKFHAVDIPSNHPIFLDNSEVVPISEQLGVPMIMRKCVTDPRWHANTTTTDHFDNEPAVALTMVMKPEDPTWGKAASNTRGSYLIVRKDMKSITPQQVQALCLFNYWHLTTYMRIFVQEYLSQIPEEVRVTARQEFLDRFATRQFLEGSLNQLALKRWDSTEDLVSWIAAASGLEP